MFYYDSSHSLNVKHEIRTLFNQRQLLVPLAIVELNNRYKKTVLGVIWSILNPLLTSLIVYFIFGGIFNGYLPGDRGYFFWVFSGFMLQIYLMQSIILVTNQLIGNLNLILNYRLSPILITIATSLSTSINFMIGCVALVPAALYSGHTISLRILLLPLFALFVTLFLTGCSTLLIHSFRKYEDSAYIVGLAILIIGYLSPFLYPFDILKPPLSTFVSMNPLTSYILTFRWLVLDDQVLDVKRILIVTGSSFAFFFLGIKYLINRWNDILML
jgi:ABC-type polysaccharide/polyol phosphate export permease